MNVYVYRLFDAADTLLYVGCTSDVAKRLGEPVPLERRSAYTQACRCDGRYDGCEHGRRCPNTGGSSHSLFFCTDCDPRRRAHITASLTAIVEASRG